jgi:hypothetical protein
MGIRLRATLDWTIRSPCWCASSAESRLRYAPNWRHGIAAAPSRERDRIGKLTEALPVAASPQAKGVFDTLSDLQALTGRLSSGRHRSGDGDIEAMPRAQAMFGDLRPSS